ncbi:MAG: hypothetical protein U0Z53_30865 [Blastocatellia bacterium]
MLSLRGDSFISGRVSIALPPVLPFISLHSRTAEKASGMRSPAIQAPASRTADETSIRAIPMRMIEIRRQVTDLIASLSQLSQQQARVMEENDHGYHGTAEPTGGSRR